jgi:hypothetical protein
MAAAVRGDLEGDDVPYGKLMGAPERLRGGCDCIALVAFERMPDSSASTP